MEYVTFNNGVKMPVLGYGTYQTPPAVTAVNVKKALNAGFRSIDTAQAYGNEAGVGQAIKDAGIARDQLFITSKAKADGYEETKQGIDASLQRFGGDYFDLMILHWPMPQSHESYRALEDAHKAGKIRTIGVSNFNAQQLDDLMADSTVKPVIDQIETHLYWQQQRMHAYLTRQGIIHESWAPLAETKGRELMNLPEIQTLAAKYGVSGAQVLIRFLTQQQIVAIPMSLNAAHIASNFDTFGFKLTDDEMADLRQFDQHHGINGWPTTMHEDQY